MKKEAECNKKKTKNEIGRGGKWSIGFVALFEFVLSFMSFSLEIFIFIHKRSLQGHFLLFKL